MNYILVGSDVILSCGAVVTDVEAIHQAQPGSAFTDVSAPLGKIVPKKTYGFYTRLSLAPPTMTSPRPLRRSCQKTLMEST